MTDKEVGELWAGLVARGFDCSSDKDMTRSLIRKLVEERAQRARTMVADVLSDFGIDPATWPNT